jgi:hypothetical protein
MTNYVKKTGSMDLSSTKITNITQLRNRLLKVFEDLEDGNIDMAQAATFAKLNETIVSGLKSEMQYAILTNATPFIPFFENNNYLIEPDETKLLK